LLLLSLLLLLLLLLLPLLLPLLLLLLLPPLLLLLPVLLLALLPLPLLSLLLPPLLLLLVLMALLLVLSVVLLLALPKRSRGERDPRRRQGTFACPVRLPFGLAPSLLRSAVTSPVSVWLSPFAFACSVAAIPPLPLLLLFKSFSRERAPVAQVRVTHRVPSYPGKLGTVSTMLLPAKPFSRCSCRATPLRAPPRLTISLRRRRKCKYTTDNRQQTIANSQ
jgi:hypothetical protein